MSGYLDEFYTVKEHVNRGDHHTARQLLSKMHDRSAQWYYLMGVTSMKLGLYDEGADFIKRANYMEPNNFEYKNAYDNIMNAQRGYNSRAHHYNRGHNNDMCDCCCKLYCADCCCECCGGDLISCC